MTNSNNNSVTVINRWLRARPFVKQITTQELYDQLGGRITFGMAKDTFANYLKDFVDSGDIEGYKLVRGRGLVRYDQLELPFQSEKIVPVKSSKKVKFSPDKIVEELKTLRRRLAYQRLQINRHIEQTDKLIKELENDN